MRDLWRRARLLSGDDRDEHGAGRCGRSFNVLKWKEVLYDVFVVQVDDETITGRMVLRSATRVTRRDSARRRGAHGARGRDWVINGGGGRGEIGNNSPKGWRLSETLRWMMMMMI